MLKVFPCYLRATSVKRRRIRKQFDLLPESYIYYEEPLSGVILSESEILYIQGQINEEELEDIKLEEKFLRGDDEALFVLLQRDIDYWREWPIQERISELYDTWVREDEKEQAEAEKKLNRLGFLGPDLDRRKKRLDLGRVEAMKFGFRLWMGLAKYTRGMRDLTCERCDYEGDCEGPNNPKNCSYCSMKNRCGGPDSPKEDCDLLCKNFVDKLLALSFESTYETDDLFSRLEEKFPSFRAYAAVVRDRGMVISRDDCQEMLKKRPQEYALAKLSRDWGVSESTIRSHVYG
jgi:hypothetical protein